MQPHLAKNMIRSMGLMMLVVMTHADLMEECQSKQLPLPHDQGTCADDTATMLQSKMTSQEARFTYDTEALGSADDDSSTLLQTPVRVSETIENLALSEEKQGSLLQESDENDDGDKLAWMVDHDDDDGDDYHDDEEEREQEEGDEKEAQDESGEDENVEDGQEDQEAKDAEMEKEGGDEDEGQLNFAEVSGRRRRISPEAREANLINKRVKAMEKQVKWARKALGSLEHDHCRRVGLSTCAYCPSSPSKCGDYCVKNTRECIRFVGNIILNFASLP